MAEQVNKKVESKKVKKYRVRTVRAIPCHLCGFDFDFKNEMVKDKEGNSVKQPCVYTLTNETPVNGREGKYGESLGEIIEKLTRPQNQIVEIIGEE